MDVGVRKSGGNGQTCRELYFSHFFRFGQTENKSSIYYIEWTLAAEFDFTVRYPIVMSCFLFLPAYAAVFQNSWSRSIQQFADARDVETRGGNNSGVVVSDFFHAPPTYFLHLASLTTAQDKMWGPVSMWNSSGLDFGPERCK